MRKWPPSSCISPINPHDDAQAGAVHKVHVGQIQHQFTDAPRQHGIHQGLGFAQPCPQRETAGTRDAQ